jgi:hypothetical protein
VQIYTQSSIKCNLLLPQQSQLRPWRFESGEILRPNPADVDFSDFPNCFFRRHDLRLLRWSRIQTLSFPVRIFNVRQRGGGVVVRNACRVAGDVLGLAQFLSVPGLR